MTKIDIISGFLGAGKTTLIKKLLAEAFPGEKLVLIENEFGEIGIDSGFLKDAGVQITEMNSGCICCSLVGDFGRALAEVLERFAPDRIVIEPSGVGKLSDVIKAVEGVADSDGVQLNSFTAVVDAKKCKMYMKNFGEFFNNQVEYAGTIILSRTQDIKQDRLEECVRLLREHNSAATVITTPWEELKGSQILDAMEKNNTLEKALLEEQKHHHHEDGEECCHGHHHHEDGEECCHGHHHHEDGEECCHGHHHHEDGEECCHGHHHHEDGEECCHDHHHHEDGEECCHDHHHHEDGEECCHDHHHHEDGEECCHGHHHHEDGGHGHHHHADEVFSSWGVETPHKFTEEELKTALAKLSGSDCCGMILRAKGIVPSAEGEWLHFDLTPGEYEIRRGAADVTGRICVIGSKLKEEEIAKLFLV